LLLSPSPTYILPLPEGGGFGEESLLILPSLWEGRKKVGGGSIFYLVTELIG